MLLSQLAETLQDALRLQGIEAKTHPIFTELTRVKQYFAKIKAAEEPPAQRSHAVDMPAAIRFIKADLVSCFGVNEFSRTPLTSPQADNQDVNTKLKEQLAKERAKAAFKAAKEAKGIKRPAEAIDDAAAKTSKDEGADADSSDDDGEVEKPEKKTNSGRRSKSDRLKNTRRGARGKKLKKDKD